MSSMNIRNILTAAKVIQQIHLIKSEALTFKAGHTGAMVVLFPSFQIAQMLSEFGTEEAKDLHITLAYLGKALEIIDPNVLLDIVSILAKDYLPLTGQVNGIGRFNFFNPDKQDVFIALPDIPKLPLFRQTVFEFIKIAGFNPREDHGFIPHITLSYLDSNEPIPIEKIPPFQLQFDSVSVILGEDRYDFPFGNGSAAQKAGARNSQIDLGRIQKIHDFCVDLGAECRAEYEKKTLASRELRD